MSTKLDELKARLTELSIDELLTLLEQITIQLRHKISLNGSTPSKVIEEAPTDY